MVYLVRNITPGKMAEVATIEDTKEHPVCLLNVCDSQIKLNDGNCNRRTLSFESIIGLEAIGLRPFEEEGMWDP